MINLKSLKILIVFYRNIIVPSLIISVVLSMLTLAAARADMHEHSGTIGVLSYLFPVFFSKTITLGCFILYYLVLRPNEMYFYYNMGISKKQIIIFTATADYLILALFLCISEMILKIFLL